MYTKGDIVGPNECDIFTGDVDYKAGTNSEWYAKVVVYGNSTGEVDEIMERIVDELNGTEVPETTPNYAAAFNMWMNDFVNSPQAYEDSTTVAIRHLTEKLNGEEPTYGQVAAQMLIEYLNKLESK